MGQNPTILGKATDQKKKRHQTPPRDLGLFGSVLGLAAAVPDLGPRRRSEAGRSSWEETFGVKRETFGAVTVFYPRFGLFPPSPPAPPPHFSVLLAGLLFFPSSFYGGSAGGRAHSSTCWDALLAEMGQKEAVWVPWLFLTSDLGSLAPKWGYFGPKIGLF